MIEAVPPALVVLVVGSVIVAVAVIGVAAWTAEVSAAERPGREGDA